MPRPTRTRWRRSTRYYPTSFRGWRSEASARKPGASRVSAGGIWTPDIAGVDQESGGQHFPVFIMIHQSSCYGISERAAHHARPNQAAQKQRNESVSAMKTIFAKTNLPRREEQSFRLSAFVDAFFVKTNSATPYPVRQGIGAWYTMPLCKVADTKMQKRTLYTTCIGIRTQR